MSDTTAQQDAMAHLIEGYADTIDVPGLKRRAGCYKPDADAEADRLAALGSLLPVSTRMAIGYHESARDAARQLNDLEK